MKGRLLTSIVLSLALAGSAAGQLTGDFLDVGIVSVKPEKRAEFESIIKKMVEANRKHQGDAWLTYEAAYGPGNTYVYVTPRKNYAAIETAYASFMGAMNKSLGPTATVKLMQDFSNCLSSSRSEFRRRRFDLGANAPSDEAGMSKLIGEARWIRTFTVHVRPGRGRDYEEQLRIAKKAREQASPKVVSMVSQAVAGHSGIVYYITNIVTSLGGLDSIPGLPEVLGEEGYKNYLRTASEIVLDSEVAIYRIVPELSNMNEAVVSVAPDFWRPKPPALVKPKATTAAGETKKQ